MIKQFQNYVWSNYSKKNVQQSLVLGIFVGFLIILGIIMMYADITNFEQNDKILAFVALMGIVVTIIIAYMNNVYQNKQLQTTSMTKIFELLSRPDVRKSREEVHREYCRLKNSKKEITFHSYDSNMKDHVDRVISSFDQVSVIVLNDLVDEDLFFDTYGEMVVRDWKTLEVEILRRQENNPRSIRHFTELKRRFLKRIENINSKRNDKNLINTEPYCE